MDKKVVIPGEFLSDNKSRSGDGTYIYKGKVYSALFGHVSGKDKIKVVSLSGKYIPSRGDMIIATVIEITYSNWFLDINSPYDGMLNISEYPGGIESGDMSKYLNISDSILVMVKEVTPLMKVELTLKNNKLQPITNGRLIKVSPVKVPRIIGRGGSMISMLKKETNSNIFIGQNGIIWITGRDHDVDKVVECIHIIEKEAYTNGLTERISTFLKKKMPVDSTNLEILNELLD
jgi:exosome complex component RRP4